jgi:hypothetical protein
MMRVARTFSLFLESHNGVRPVNGHDFSNMTSFVCISASIIPPYLTCTFSKPLRKKVQAN